MVTTTANGHPHALDDAPRVVRHIPRAVTPDDVVPRLVGMGMPVDEALQLADNHDEQRIFDALDAVEEFGVTSRIINPVGWVRAAVRREWDLTGVLAERRENERRQAVLDADQQEREFARDAFPAWRAISERWDRAISAALNDDQLERALGAVSRPSSEIGRHSIPIARAELIAWAVDAHGREPGQSLAETLADDLDRGPRRPEAPRWPLPEPPTLPEDDERRSLSARIADALGRDLDAVRDQHLALAVSIPQRTVRFGQDLER